MPRVSEKGQGLAEYFTILAIVAILTIAFLMLFGPVIEDVFVSVGRQGETSPNGELLSDAPIITESGSHPVSLGGVNLDDYIPTYIYPGCETWNVQNTESIKVGTNYSNPDLITISRVDDKSYSICNNDFGATVYLIVAIVETPQ